MEHGVLLIYKDSHNNASVTWTTLLVWIEGKISKIIFRTNRFTLYRNEKVCSSQREHIQRNCFKDTWCSPQEASFHSHPPQTTDGDFLNCFQLQGYLHALLLSLQINTVINVNQIHLYMLRENESPFQTGKGIPSLPWRRLWWELIKWHGSLMAR